MPEQNGEKTHDATPHRREKAREQGQVARSQDLTSAALLMAGLGGLWWLGRGIFEFLGQTAQRQLGGDAWLQADKASVTVLWVDTLSGLAWVLLPLMMLMMLSSAGVQLGQIGILFLPNKLGFDVSRISPWSGLKRLFSMQNLMRFVQGIFKLLVAAAVAIWSLWSEWGSVVASIGLAPMQMAVFLVNITFWTCMKIAGALLVLAIIDYMYQWWKHEQDLKMTTEELREEMKSTQGDPQIIARRRAVQRQLAMQRLEHTVPGATAVIANPTELAIAIKYDEVETPVPQVVAKGGDAVAQRIRRIALEHGIPVVERKELARALFKEVEVGEYIPDRFFGPVIEVLHYVYALTGKTPGGQQR